MLEPISALEKGSDGSAQAPVSDDSIPKTGEKVNTFFKKAVRL